MWARIEPLLSCSDGQRGRPFREHRQVVEGIVFRLRTAVPWRDLPAEFVPWQTVWKRHDRVARDGTWDRVLTALHVEADAAGRLDCTVSVDSTVARVHQYGATAPGRLDMTPPVVGAVAAAVEPGGPQLAWEGVVSAGPLTGGTSERQGCA